MATKTIHVCDICGNEAVSKRTIDVCKTHAATPKAKTDGRSASRELVACSVCGEKFKAGAGLSAHMRFGHKGEKPVAKKIPARKAPARKRAAKKR